MKRSSRSGVPAIYISPRRLAARCGPLAAAALIVGTISAARPCAADSINLLLNPGFESGDFAAWSVSGTSIQFGVARDGVAIPNADPPFPPNVQNVRSGRFAANALVSAFADPIERIVLRQTVSVQARQQLRVGFWLGNDSQSDFGMEIGGDPPQTQILVNGVGILPEGFVQPGTGGSPRDFLLISGAFDTGTRRTLDVAFTITGSGTSRVGLSLDDFFVAPTPEPSSMLLLATGVALAFRTSRTRRNETANKS
jgi:PEP-CTERM motif